MSNVTERLPKHKNIPVFIPHMGCPHRCTFCDQRAISGHARFVPEHAKREIEQALATLPEGARAQIAYFGGSFTAIDRDLMVQLLDLAQSYVDAGRVSGIRFSTRPDAVGEDVLDLLERYDVEAIELGLQSMDDEVLRLCERGHTAAQAEDACRRVAARGYELVGQMMLGLPASTEQKELDTAVRICELGAHAMRLYPTVVLDGTPLADAMRMGAYTPLTDDEAAARAAKVLRLLEERGVDVLRVGLCSSEELRSSRVLGGASHPALGEMAYSALFYVKMREQLAACPSTKGRVATFCIPRGKVSQAIGQRRANVAALTREFQLSALKVVESEEYSSTQAELCSLA